MLRRMVGVAAALALAWAVLVWISGGTTIAVAGLRVSSTDPIRPLVAAALLAAIYILTSGRQRVREDAAFARRLATASRLAAVLAATIGAIAIAQSSCTASGADAYAYVTQADLLLAGRLTVPVPIANEVPWPAPLPTFVPFGYAAVAHESAIASAVGPGLPLLMDQMADRSSRRLASSEAPSGSMTRKVNAKSPLRASRILPSSPATASGCTTCCGRTPRTRPPPSCARWSCRRAGRNASCPTDR